MLLSTRPDQNLGNFIHVRHQGRWHANRDPPSTPRIFSCVWPVSGMHYSFYLSRQMAPTLLVEQWDAFTFLPPLSSSAVCLHQCKLTLLASWHTSPLFSPRPASALFQRGSGTAVQVLHLNSHLLVMVQAPFVHLVCYLCPYDTRDGCLRFQILYLAPSLVKIWATPTIFSCHPTLSQRAGCLSSSLPYSIQRTVDQANACFSMLIRCAPLPG